MKTNPQPRTVSPKGAVSIWRIVFSALLGMALLALFIITVDVLLIGFGAVLYAVFLHGLARAVADHSPVPYRAALAAIVVGAPLILVGAGFVLGPDIAEQIDDLLSTLPETWHSVDESIQRYRWLAWLFDRAPSPAEFAAGDSSLIAQVSGLFSSVAGWAVNVAFIVVAGIFLAIAPSLYVDPMLRLLPPDSRARGRYILREIEVTLRRWLIGRITSMLIVGVMTTVGLYALGVPLALVLGVFAGVLAFVPTIGPIVSAIPALLVASADGPHMVLYVLCLYIGVQLIESYLITPLIEKRAVSLPPGYVLMGQLFIGVLLGIPGLIVATPIVVVVLILVKLIYIEPMELTVAEDGRIVIDPMEPRAADSECIVERDGADAAD